MMKTIESIIDKSSIGFVMAKGDYIKDNLCYCGNCKTAKQCVVELFGAWRTVPCVCKCKMEEIEQDKEDRAARSKEYEIQRLRSQGIQDKQMKDFTFANGASNKATKTAWKYYNQWNEMHKENIGLLFWGTVGTGKTYASACITNALLDDGVPVLMTNFGKLINALSGFAIEDKNAYIDSLNKYKLLVIDDLGIEGATDYRLEIVFSVIDGRYKSNQPLIITTNLTVDEMQGTEDIRKKRIYDRILEMCTPIIIEGESLREQASLRKMQKAKELFE